MPLTNNVIIDQARALDLIDQLRVAVPEEVRQAKRINEESERIAQRAHEEAERILARAQEQAAFLIEERELTRPRRSARRRSSPPASTTRTKFAAAPTSTRRACSCISRGSASRHSRASSVGLPCSTIVTSRATASTPGPCRLRSPSRSPCVLSYNVASLLRAAPGTVENHQVNVDDLEVADGIESSRRSPARSGYRLRAAASSSVPT